MINIPLLALFGMAYGLGHPGLAAMRPVSVDKTLASFHNDVNKTIAEVSTGSKILVQARETLLVSAGALNVKSPSEPARAIPKASKPASVAPPVSKIEILKAPKTGFSELRG
jgi:hypothetical protein